MRLWCSEIEYAFAQCKKSLVMLLRNGKVMPLALAKILVYGCIRPLKLMFQLHNSFIFVCSINFYVTSILLELLTLLLVYQDLIQNCAINRFSYCWGVNTIIASLFSDIVQQVSCRIATIFLGVVLTMPKQALRSPLRQF